MAKFWEENKTFSTKIDKNKEKFYCLEMFLTYLEKFTWGMLETIQLEMY